MKYTVMIPHQLRPSIHVWSEDEVISMAHSECNKNGCGSWWDWSGEQEVEDCYGEDAPDELLQLAKGGPVTEIAGPVGHTQGYYRAGEEPYSRFDWACEVLGSDLHALLVFDSMDDLAEWASTYWGHGWIQVQAEVERLMIEAEA